ncbi:MAG: peptidoglycan DD-metalloendopeptidase family protein [Candidatus Riflebacteria bacterium]|nr:peptidoglycan DD-metalloendopeptidase family protein [Candidatus Riflebacteria bacterium]
MLGKKNERHYGIILFSIGLVILFQSLAIGHDSSRLEKPAMTLLLSLEATAAGPSASSARPPAPATSSVARLAPSTHEEAIAAALGSQGLFFQPPAALSMEDLTYTLQAGDTFYGVARQFGMSARDLANANGLVKMWAPTGTVLRVPRRSAAAVLAQAQPAVEHLISYRAKAGDSLATIAERFHMNLSELLTENRIYSGVEPKAGQELRVRVPPTIEYKVSAGESLWKVSKTYEVPLASLVELNNLALADLQPGQVIRIPVKDPAVLDRLWRSRHPVASRKSDSGKFRLPVVGAQITDRFGMRTHPIYRIRDFHRGLDFAAPYGTPIKAAKAGLVKYAGFRQGYGRCIVVGHADGTETWYAHCSALLARVGTQVKAGDRLARIGSSGTSTGPHLHFEIRKHNRAVNPQKHLRV